MNVQMVAIRALLVGTSRVMPGARFLIDAKSAADLLRAGRARLVHADDLRVLRDALLNKVDA